MFVGIPSLSHDERRFFGSPNGTFGSETLPVGCTKRPMGQPTAAQKTPAGTEAHRGRSCPHALRQGVWQLCGSDSRGGGSRKTEPEEFTQEGRSTSRKHQLVASPATSFAAGELATVASSRSSTSWRPVVFSQFGIAKFDLRKPAPSATKAGGPTLARYSSGSASVAIVRQSSGPCRFRSGSSMP